MTSTNVADFRKNLMTFLNQAVKGNNVISISTEEGNAVILSGEEYFGLLETIRLMSIPGMREKLIKGMETPIEECDDFEW